MSNDLLLSLDKGDEVVLILLDYSAAFDTINHDTLFSRLKNDYGIGGSVLKWCISYLEHRKQAVVIDNTVSDPIALLYGTPQGSVKGPLDFILYTGPLSNIVNSHSGINHMIYADDTQLYLVMKSTHHSSAINKLEACIADVRSWAIQNKLMLNDAKTEVLHIHSQFRATSPLPSINIGGSYISPSKSARDLGAIIDDEMQLKSHVRNICRSASFGIYKIGRLRKYLDKKSTERLVHAFVSSRLDFNNSLLYGLPSAVLSSLQRVQNSAARLISYTKRHHHISPVLRNLHWLPIRERIMFKILLITYKAIHGSAPAYISDLISISKNARLRSSSMLLLKHGPRVNTISYGDRAFAVAAPKLWNNIPFHIRSSPSINVFKNKLKTHLFN